MILPAPTHKETSRGKQSISENPFVMENEKQNGNSAKKNVWLHPALNTNITKITLQGN